MYLRKQHSSDGVSRAIWAGRLAGLGQMSWEEYSRLTAGQQTDVLRTGTVVEAFKAAPSILEQAEQTAAAMGIQLDCTGSFQAGSFAETPFQGAANVCRVPGTFELFSAEGIVNTPRVFAAELQRTQAIEEAGTPGVYMPPVAAAPAPVPAPAPAPVAVAVTPQMQVAPAPPAGGGPQPETGLAPEPGILAKLSQVPWWVWAAAGGGGLLLAGGRAGR